MGSDLSKGYLLFGKTRPTWKIPRRTYNLTEELYEIIKAFSMNHTRNADTKQPHFCLLVISPVRHACTQTNVMDQPKANILN